MSVVESSAPLFTKTYDLVLWLSGRVKTFPKDQRFGLAARIMQQAYTALEAITLALKGFERPDNVERADAAFALLRVYLRLATDQKLLRSRQLTFVVGRIEELGRMVGGWRKRL